MYLSGKEINPSVEGKIEGFANYLKRANQLLVNYKEFVKKLLQLRESDNKQNELIVTYLMPEYEKTCLSEYVGPDNLDVKLIFSCATDTKLAQLTQSFVRFEFGGGDLHAGRLLVC